MTIIMVLIHRLIAQFNEYQYHHIGSEIGKRVDGIRYHGCRMSENTCSKLQYEQHHIDDASRYRHLIYFLYSIRISGMILSCPYYKILQKSFASSIMFLDNQISVFHELSGKSTSFF